MTRAEAKAEAKSYLNANWGYAILQSFLYGLLAGAASALAGVGYLIVNAPLEIGNIAVFNLGRKTHKIDIDHIFDGFKQGLGDRILLSILREVFLFLWSLLLFVPGIIKSYAYALAPYISYMHPETTWNDCLKESQKRMVGHKWSLFVFDLSFIGWYFLCLFSLGIGYLWLYPYISASRISFINGFYALGDETYTTIEVKKL
jgi:uncharacterized membrane protein